MHVKPLVNVDDLICLVWP